MKLLEDNISVIKNKKEFLKLSTEPDILIEII